jgi:hypothetical protein
MRRAICARFLKSSLVGMMKTPCTTPPALHVIRMGLFNRFLQVAPADREAVVGTQPMSDGRAHAGSMPA